MEIKNLVKVYDEAISQSDVNKIIMYCKTVEEFQKGKIGNDEGVENTNIRKVLLHEVVPVKKSMTMAFIHNFLKTTFFQHFFRYKQETGCTLNMSFLNEMSILKYEPGHFFRPHFDAGTSPIRNVSFILMLNNDYEGGELSFFDPDCKTNEYTVDVKPGRLIVWPSYWMFPHGVKPVTKGIRYAIVSWGQ